ncbi:MAG: LysR family transcriptional regulator [Methanobrevibacter sp.]|jgi:molybdenum-dependent DNA-binding transcriptional regulator ModE|nr:LysR family transcriptional regulator [Methanobrevibacter sp.]
MDSQKNKLKSIREENKISEHSVKLTETKQLSLDKFQPEIGMEIDGNSYSHKLFKTLELIAKNGSQRKTAEKLNVAHSVLNRRIKNAELKLGFNLVESSKIGSYLSEKAKQLLDEYIKYENKVVDMEKIMVYGGPITLALLEYLKDDFPANIGLYSCSAENSYCLAERNLVDILALDDPLLGFKKDLDFIPIAHDYLVLLTNDENQKTNEIKHIDNLDGLDFVSVNGTAQRLAWQTLKDNDINFNIVETFNSQYAAFKMVKNSRSLYTFLNASFFSGNNILKRETEHVISLIPLNKDKRGVDEFINYVLNEGQGKIAKQGFTPIKPWKR